MEISRANSVEASIAQRAITFGEDPGAPIDWARQNKGITPVFSIETVERRFYVDADGKRVSPKRDELDLAGNWQMPPGVVIASEKIEGEVVQLKVAGDHLGSPAHPVDGAIRERFAEQYESWKAGREMAQRGHTLEEWPPLFSRKHGDTPPPKLIAEMHARDLYTVEDLAAIPDAMLGLFHGDRVWRDKAIAWLADKEKFAVTDELAKENALQKARIEAMERQIAKLSAQPKRKKRISGAMRKKLNAERIRNAPKPATCANEQVEQEQPPLNPAA